ncbi:MAG: hypothetical protein AAF065_03760 [Verrucomicrobiota bacterium]
MNRYTGTSAAQRPLRSAKTRPAKANYSFKTNAEGWIPTAGTFAELFASLLELPSIRLQLEHAYGSLAMQMSNEELGLILSGLQLDPAIEISHDEADPLIDSWARLEVCDQCGSPGFLNCYNFAGLRLLKIQASAGVEPSDWARVLEQVTDPSKLKTVAASDSFPEKTSQQKPLPDDFHPVEMKKWTFLRLIVEYSKRSLPLEFCLPSYGLSLRSAFTVQEIDEGRGLLTCMSPRAGFQLNMSALETFAVGTRDGRETLFLMSSTDSTMLEVAPPSNSVGASFWLDEIQEAIADSNP